MWNAFKKKVSKSSGSYQVSSPLSSSPSSTGGVTSLYHHQDFNHHLLRHHHVPTTSDAEESDGSGSGGSGSGNKKVKVVLRRYRKLPSYSESLNNADDLNVTINSSPSSLWSSPRHENPYVTENDATETGNFTDSVREIESRTGIDNARHHDVVHAGHVATELDNDFSNNNRRSTLCGTVADERQTGCLESVENGAISQQDDNANALTEENCSRRHTVCQENISSGLSLSSSVSAASINERKLSPPRLKRREKSANRSVSSTADVTSSDLLPYVHSRSANTIAAGITPSKTERYANLAHTTVTLDNRFSSSANVSAKVPSASVRRQIDVEKQSNARCAISDEETGSSDDYCTILADSTLGTDSQCPSLPPKQRKVPPKPPPTSSLTGAISTSLSTTGPEDDESGYATLNDCSFSEFGKTDKFNSTLVELSDSGSAAESCRLMTDLSTIKLASGLDKGGDTWCDSDLDTSGDLTRDSEYDRSDGGGNAVVDVAAELRPKDTLVVNSTNPSESDGCVDDNEAAVALTSEKQLDVVDIARPADDNASKANNADDTEQSDVESAAVDQDAEEIKQEIQFDGYNQGIGFRNEAFSSSDDYEPMELAPLPNKSRANDTEDSLLPPTACEHVSPGNDTLDSLSQQQKDNAELTHDYEDVPDDLPCQSADSMADTNINSSLDVVNEPEVPPVPPPRIGSRIVRRPQARLPDDRDVAVELVSDTVDDVDTNNLSNNSSFQSTPIHSAAAALASSSSTSSPRTIVGQQSCGSEFYDSAVTSGLKESADRLISIEMDDDDDDLLMVADEGAVPEEPTHMSWHEVMQSAQVLGIPLHQMPAAMIRSEFGTSATAPVRRSSLSSSSMTSSDRSCAASPLISPIHPGSETASAAARSASARRWTPGVRSSAAPDCSPSPKHGKNRKSAAMTAGIMGSGGGGSSSLSPFRTRLQNLFARRSDDARSTSLGKAHQQYRREIEAAAATASVDGSSQDDSRSHHLQQTDAGRTNSNQHLNHQTHHPHQQQQQQFVRQQFSSQQRRDSRKTRSALLEYRTTSGSPSLKGSADSPSNRNGWCRVQSWAQSPSMSLPAGDGPMSNTASGTASFGRSAATAADGSGSGSAAGMYRGSMLSVLSSSFSSGSLGSVFSFASSSHSSNASSSMAAAIATGNKGSSFGRQVSSPLTSGWRKSTCLSGNGATSIVDGDAVSRRSARRFTTIGDVHDDIRSSVSIASTTSSSNTDFMDGLRQLKDCEWYWGSVTWEDAAVWLADLPDGSFIIRDSSDERYILSLSFRSQGATHHTRIEHYKGQFWFYAQPHSSETQSSQSMTSVAGAASCSASNIVEFVDRAVALSRTGQCLYFLRPRASGQTPVPVQLLYPVPRPTSSSAISDGADRSSQTKRQQPFPDEHARQPPPPQPQQELDSLQEFCQTAVGDDDSGNESSVTRQRTIRPVVVDDNDDDDDDEPPPIAPPRRRPPSAPAANDAAQGCHSSSTKSGTSDVERRDSVARRNMKETEC